MGNVFAKIHEYSLKNGKPNNPVNLRVSAEGKEVYRKLHDEIVAFRKNMEESENYISIRTKSLGMLLRVAGAINRLREGQKKCEKSDYEFENVITEDDMKMAESIVDHCVRSSMIAIGGNNSNKSETPLVIKKSCIPEPKNMTVDFISLHQRHVVNILKNEQISLGKIAANNHYPTINNVRGSIPAQKFTNGLCHLGLGELVEVSNERSKKVIMFKRYHPYDTNVNAEKREKVRKIWSELNININLGKENQVQEHDDSLSSQKVEEIYRSIKAGSGVLSEIN